MSCDCRPLPRPTSLCWPRWTPPLLPPPPPPRSLRCKTPPPPRRPAPASPAPRLAPRSPPTPERVSPPLFPLFSAAAEMSPNQIYSRTLSHRRIVFWQHGRVIPPFQTEQAISSVPAVFFLDPFCNHGSLRETFMRSNCIPLIARACFHSHHLPIIGITRCLSEDQPMKKCYRLCVSNLGVYQAHTCRISLLTLVLSLQTSLEEQLPASSLDPWSELPCLQRSPSSSPGIAITECHPAEEAAPCHLPRSKSTFNLPSWLASTCS